MSDWAAFASLDGLLPMPAAFAAALLPAAAGLRLALVGGAVRDLLAHRVHRDPWQGLQDLDLVVEAPQDKGGTCEPAAHRLAQALQAIDPSAIRFCHVHWAYGTVELQWEDLLLDLATARSESYPVPGENPVVQPGTLESDLARRDFSVNAMALLLAGDRVELIDPHGGLADLQARRLRLLHQASLRDDPTRLVRGARYGARLGFSLDGASLEQAREVLRIWPWAWRHGDDPAQAPAALGTRLRIELELLLEREPWERALSLLQDWGALVLLDPALQANRSWRRRLLWARRLGLPPLVALVQGASDPLGLAARLQLPHAQQRGLVRWLALRLALTQASGSDSWAPSRWCALLEAKEHGPMAVALALAAGDCPRRPLWRWWCCWRHVRPPCTASELMAREGLLPGPELGARIRQLRAELLDDPTNNV